MLRVVGVAPLDGEVVDRGIAREPGDCEIADVAGEGAVVEHRPRDGVEPQALAETVEGGGDGGHGREGHSGREGSPLGPARGRLVAGPRIFLNDTLPRAAAADEVEDFGAEVGEPLLADALAPQQRGG